MLEKLQYFHKTHFITSLLVRLRWKCKMRPHPVYTLLKVKYIYTGCPRCYVTQSLNVNILCDKEMLICRAWWQHWIHFTATSQWFDAVFSFYCCLVNCFCDKHYSFFNSAAYEEVKQANGARCLILLDHICRPFFDLLIKGSTVRICAKSGWVMLIRPWRTLCFNYEVITLMCNYNLICILKWHLTLGCLAPWTLCNWNVPLWVVCLAKYWYY